MAKYLPNPKDKSTWTGLAQVVTGLGVLFAINEAPAVADAVQQVGGAYSDGVLVPVAIQVGLGLFDLFRRERTAR